jgi:hypothetical protein
MGDQDHSYKLLFAHPQLVRELLEAFVGGDWLGEVDFDTLQRVSDAYISDDLRARADDIVWRVRCGSRQVYLLIEFQSRVDTFMAVRVLAYVALLYQDLIRAREIDLEKGLPAILPVVLHNGSRRWQAAEDLGSLLEPAPSGLEQYCPNLRYVLIDEGSYDDGALARHDNLIATLFRLEQCRDHDLIEPLVNDLVEKLKETGQESLCRAFSVWLSKVILARLSGERMTVDHLWEKQTMLSERFDEWEAQFRREGRQEGRREGREEGIQEGRQDGEVTLLTRQLLKRFGELPDSVRSRLRSAPLDELEHWGERLLDVSSLDELFTDAQSSFS